MGNYMDLKLENKVAVVTGASRGIGAAVVNRLVREGVRVLGVARHPEAAEHPDDVVRMLSVDLAADHAAEAVVDAAVEAFGRIDLLVNNAGGGARLTLAPFVQLSEEDWDDALTVNLLAAVRMTKAATPWLEQTRGTVVNVSSIGAHRVDGPPLAYNVAKAALAAFGKGVAPELAARGIRIATVTPGPTRTAMWDRFAEAAGAPVDAVLAKIPQQMGMLTGRLIDPAEVADAIAYLASQVAGNIVGAEIVIDGGALRGA
jgi:NAD(P)-dependent dehydrogenase (short-subunit alcohol dehydrogenase family)